VWALKLECLQVLTGLVTYFGKPLAQRVPALLPPCWHLFTTSGRDLYLVRRQCDSMNEPLRMLCS
jgi:hypothetical protein